MKILFATSEALPFVATGGLADVSQSLPKAIKAKGHDIRVVLPYYKAIKDKWESQLSYITNFTVTLAWRRIYCGVFHTEYDGVKYYFLDNEYYFKRGGVYGDFDDCERFAFFSKAIIDFMQALDFFPDVLHANDWQTSLTIPYLKKIYYGDFKYSSVKTVFTIHNIMYQGRYGNEIFGDVIGLPEVCKSDLLLDGDINLMKGAIQTADAVTTVSNSYRDELLRGENSYRMEIPLSLRRDKFTGIVNGIDYKEFKNEKGKSEYASELRHEVNLCESDVPIIAIISRMCEQKGMSILKRALENLLNRVDFQLIILGTGEYIDEEFFKYLERIHSDKVRTFIKFDKDLSKRIYAGSDMLLMPSKTEPCGIAQMIACAYGTIPIVRETGGLRDTIKCYDPNNKEATNGFSFYDYSPTVLEDTVIRTIELFYNKSEWYNLVTRAKLTDFSWKKSCEKYIEVYNNL